MAASPKPGDHVTWNTPQGRTGGVVVRKVASTAKVGGHTAKASPAQPQLEVKSDKTGKRAIHRPSALKKTKARG